jgi:hypothetical protein
MAAAFQTDPIATSPTSEFRIFGRVRIGPACPSMAM